MPALTAQHLRKAFGAHVVLEDATFTITRAEKVGLIGANGAGKSTLAKILAGLEPPDGGTLSVRRGIRVRYLAQEPELDPAQSARAVVEEALTAWRAATAEHAALTARLEHEADAAAREGLVARQAELADAVDRLGGWERGHQALDFLDRLGVRDVERPCGERSGGERRRIALAQLLVASPDVVILDEPTNHLDADTILWLETYLAREFRGAVVLVTHDRYVLDAVAARIIELERGRITTFPGGFGEYLERKAEIVAHEERVEQNRQNALRREREWLARGPKARTTKQKARIDRAQALEARTPATAGRPGAAVLSGAAAPRQGKTILELRKVQTAPADALPPLHEPFDLFVTAGERIGVVGPNGCGKTTLLRAVLGAVERARGVPEGVAAPAVVAGEVVVGRNTRPAYLDQARAGLDDAQSVFDEVRGAGGGTMVDLGPGREAMDLRSYLELFLFDGHAQRQKVGSLSGGERARVALAKVLREGANLLFFDEPTNDLDLATLGAFEDLLLSFEGSTIVVTHDRALLDRVATAILAFQPPAGPSGPATVIRYAGGYQDYLSQRGDPVSSPVEATARSPVPSARAPAPPPASPPKAKAKGLTYAERIELDSILETIDAAERKVAEIEALLADPSLYAERGHEVAGLQARLVAARSEAGALVARWEALETKKAGG